MLGEKVTAYHYPFRFDFQNAYLILKSSKKKKIIYLAVYKYATLFFILSDLYSHLNLC